MSEKEKVAQDLAQAHFDSESTVLRVLRLYSDKEGDPSEPIKLLEVNTATPSTGIMPVYFGPSGQIPYASIVVEVTNDEFNEIQDGSRTLPHGWQIGQTLFVRTPE